MNKIYGKLAILGSRGIPARCGGFETFAEELAVRLARRGEEVTVYCEGNGRGKSSTYKNVELVHLTSPKMGPLTTIIFDIRCLCHARKKFDVVYMLGYGTSLFCLIPRLWGTRVWINMDGVEWARLKWGQIAKVWFKAMEFLATKVSDRIIADAEGIRGHLETRHHPLPYCTVIPYGARVVHDRPESKFLEEWHLSAWGYYLLVARLEPENHIFDILKGFLSSVSNKAILVVGDHSVKTSYVNKLLSIEDPRLRFLGSIYDQAILRTLRYYAFCYFHGHSVGGTNPSLLEALGCGNPTIAHNNQFNREVAGDAALYFNRAEEIPVLVELLESSLEKRQHMRDRAYEIVCSRYTWESVADKYYDLLKQDAIRR